MTEETKLLLILMQIENITKLIEGNQWEGFYKNQLYPAYYETQRQLSCINARKETVR
jgi:hypothetical protein